MMQLSEKGKNRADYLLAPSRNQVVRLKKWVETQQKVYLVMDLCEGPTLEEFMR